MKPKIIVIGLKGLPGFGGAAGSAGNVLMLLKSQYDFLVYSVDSHTNLHGEYNGIYQIVFRGVKNPLFNTFQYYIKCLLRALFVDKADLIFLNHAESGFITPFLRIKYGNILLTVRGVFDKKDTKFGSFVNLFFKLSERLNYFTATDIVSVSKPDIKHIANITRKPVIHIPNGVHLVNPIAEVELKFENYWLFSAARIYSIKGLHLIIESFSRLGLKEPLLIVGDIDQVPDYKEMILSKSSSLNIHFIGLLKDKSLLNRYISKAKVFIFPSLFEGMSNMLLEVASMQVPIICSDIPSNTEIFSLDQVLFFKSDNVEDLMNKIKFASKNPSIMKSKAEKAYKKLEAGLTWDKVAEEYAKLFNQIILKRNFK